MVVSPSSWLSLGTGCPTLKDHHSSVSASSSCLSPPGGPCTAPPHPGMPPSRHIRPGPAKSSGQRWFGIVFFPLVFSFYQRIVPAKSGFPRVAALVGLQGQMCPCAVIPWGWSQGCSSALILSQNNPAGCVPHPMLPVPGVVRLDSSPAGEASLRVGALSARHGVTEIPQFCY